MPGADTIEDTRGNLELNWVSNTVRLGLILLLYSTEHRKYPANKCQNVGILNSCKDK